ncbi:MAG: DNA mismatch repair protein MutS [Pirellulales bacterium]
MSDTPMMRQYREAKAACPDAVLLFRMGDFYELFHEDARTAARVLHLTLTSREKGENAIPMAGFPYHQLESYLAKLIHAGFRAAICEQVEDPKQAKGLVRREVTRVVTAGTLVEDALLDPTESNYLAAVAPGDTAGLAWIELSTGRFQACDVPAARLADELARIAPSELLWPEGQDAPRGDRWRVTLRPAWSFGASAAAETISRHFQTAGVEGFGFDDVASPAVRAAGAALAYLAETQRTSLEHIERIEPYAASGVLQIDAATRRSLEITRTMREGRRDGSLLAVIDRTVTAMGSRLLAEWLSQPLTDVLQIRARHDAVAELLDSEGLTADLRERLSGVYDLERLLARVSTGRATPRDLSFLARTLRLLPALKARLTARSSGLLQRLERELDLCEEIRAKLDGALVDDCPLLSREGGFIRPEFSPELDNLRDLAAGGKQWIARYQAQEVERTGISSLKVGFNKVFGYYLEISHIHGAKVPPEYIRKQTVKNAERYVTPELKEYEEKVLAADERGKELEYELFTQLRDAVAAELRRIQGSARVLARLDVLASLAELARRQGYCRPEVVADPVLEIHDGRHPVLEAILPTGAFVPNDTQAGGEQPLLLITGPNMAGKSTYIRQVALISLLGQMGSFVPARAAKLGVADRIFARVGASDELSRGQSTFMVEMTEAARILNTATSQSLVVLDEIGRGTSTYDGVSLAWAIVEHLHDRIGCRTFFATHYHELTELDQSLSGVVNLNVAVREWEDQVVFLHKIVPGAADRSYGIHVARLAGVPRAVYRRAENILKKLEAEHGSQAASGRRKPKLRATIDGALQLTLFEPAEHPLADKLRQVDLNGTTPLEALRMLKEFQEELTPK